MCPTGPRRPSAEQCDLVRAPYKLQPTCTNERKAVRYTRISIGTTRRTRENTPRDVRDNGNRPSVDAIGPHDSFRNELFDFWGVRNGNNDFDANSVR